MKLRWFALATVIWSLEASVIATTDSAAMFELNRQGLALLAQSLEQTLRRDIVDVPLPNFRKQVGLGVEIGVEQASYSIGFDTLRIEPQQGHLLVRVAVKQVKLHAGRIKLKKNILGRDIRSTCTNTQIKLGHKHSIPLMSQVRIGIDQGDVTVSMPHVGFELDANNYTVSGPKRCSGDLGVGRLLRSIVHAILEQSRKRIIEAAKQQVRKLEDDMEGILNAHSHAVMSFELGIPPLPRQTVSVRTWPYRIAIDDKMLRFELGAEINSAALPAKSFYPAPKVILGAIGINLELLNQALAKLANSMTEPLASGDGLHAKFSKALSIEYASAVWPDLREVALTGSNLGLKFSLSQAPRVEAEARSSHTDLKLHIPALTLHFDAPIAGALVPYFDLDLDLQARLDLMEADGMLLVQLAELPKFSISGRWADGYTPRNNLFEQDLTETLFASAVDYLYASGPLWRGELVLPGIPERIKLINPRLVRSYLILSLQN
jgi:hypothetical protein